MKRTLLASAAAWLLAAAPVLAAIPSIPPSAPYQAATYDFKANGGICNGQDITGVSLTASGTTLSSTSYTFTQADVGKLIAVPGAGVGTTSPVSLNTSIASVSGGNATLSVAATNTVNAAAVTSGSTIVGNVLTVGTLSSGALNVGQVLTGTQVAAGTIIIQNISGSGTGSTWYVYPGQTLNVASTAITASEPATFGSDDTTSLQALNTKVGALPNGGLIQLPAGTCIQSASITQLSNVGYFGQGMHVTRLKWISPNNMTAMFQGLTGTASAPYQNITMHDMEADADSAILSPYTASGKFIASQHMKDISYHHLYLHGFPSTCLGSDFIVGGSFDHNLLVRCGRLTGGSGPGGAGIGIGAGSDQNEAWTASDNIIQDPGTFGIFWEGGFALTTPSLGHVAVSANVIYNTGLANTTQSACIGDAGGEYVDVSGNDCYSIGGGTQAAGIVVNGGTLNQTGAYGQHGNFSSNSITGYQTGIALLLGSPTGASGANHMTVEMVANNVQRSTNSCYTIQSPATGSLDTVNISANTGTGCGTAGIIISGSSTATLIKMSANILTNNGVVTGTTTAKAGIAINGNASNIQITDNILGDNGTGTQKYGISFLAGFTVSDFQITANKFTGNATAPINFSSTPTASEISNNMGYNPVGSGATTPGASPWTYTAGLTPEVLYVYGATTVSATVGGNTVCSGTTACGITLAPNQATVVTYTGSPSATADKK